MAQSRVVFLHTVVGLEGRFGALAAEFAPQALLSHISDETLIQAILTAGGVTPAVVRRVCDHVVAAEGHGAAVVQFTCSTISPCAATAAGLVSIPVLTIDAPMVRRAVADFGRIGVIATNPATLIAARLISPDVCSCEVPWSGVPDLSWCQQTALKRRTPSA